MPVRDAFIPLMMMPVIRRQTQKEPGHPTLFDISPRTVIAPCAVPAAFEGTIPETLIKDDIYACIRNRVGISSGYQHHLRRRGKPIGREIDPYADTHAGMAFGWTIQSGSRYYNAQHDSNKSELFHESIPPLRF
jgi:hypothetical protein